MSIQVITKLNSREKERKCQECIQFLQEQGRYQDPEQVYTTLLEARRHMQELIQELTLLEKDSAAASKYAGAIDTLLQTLTEPNNPS